MARPKGSVNRNRAAMMAAIQLRAGKDFDPVALMAEQAVELVKVANKSRRTPDRESAIAALDKIAPYVMPKLKSVEVDVSNTDGTLRPVSRIELIAVTEVPVAPEPPSEVADESTDAASE